MLNATRRRALNVALCAVALASLAACEKRTRTRNSSGSSDLFEEGAAATTNVYRFVGVEQSLTDARKAVTDERWDQAIAATDALLKQQPGNAEAKQINAQGRLELPNQTRWNELNKAAAANEVSAVIRQYRAISDASMYKPRATEIFDKLRGPFVDNQIGDARALVRAGRCDEARRVARVTGDWFPDARARLDDAASGCRPAKNEKEVAAPAVVATTEVPKVEEKKEAPLLMTPPPAPMPSAPVAMAAEVAKPESSKPAEARMLAASLPAGTALSATPPAVAPAPPPTPAPLAATRNIPINELEALRVGGDKAPSLPAGAKMIARRDSVKRIMMALKVCVSDKGVPTSVNFVKSSDYADANERVMSEVRKWRFRPYLSNGEPVPVCTATLLNYQIE